MLKNVATMLFLTFYFLLVQRNQKLQTY